MRHHDHRAMPREAIEADVREALAVLAGIGVRPCRWRPPFGTVTPHTRRVAASHGLELVGWSCDPCDWRGDTVEYMLATVASQFEPGSVVLLHDAVGPGALRRDCADTVAIIDPLAQLIRANGCEPAALGTGPAFWWAREGPQSGRRGARDLLRAGRKRLRKAAVRAPRRSSADYTVELVDEALLGESDRATIAMLLAEAFASQGDAYRERGWRNIAPTFRTLARCDQEIVAQQSVFEIGTDAPHTTFGLGDVAVRADRRRRGIARALIERAVQECWRRGAEIVLTDTAALRETFMTLGFRPVPRFAFYYQRDGQCRWHPHWLAAVRTALPRAPLRLVEGDF
jgi:predicted N-acetyltransferase YhbS